MEKSFLFLLTLISLQILWAAMGWIPNEERSIQITKKREVCINVDWDESFSNISLVFEKDLKVLNRVETLVYL